MTKRKAKQQTFDIQKLTIYGATVSVVSLFILYIYLVSSSVLHVVMRQEVERQNSALYSEISRLEASYIKAQHSLSEDIATMQGYVVADTKIFIDRSSVAAVALGESDE